MRYWDILEQLLCAFMRVKQTYLQIEDRFSSYAEQEMSWLNYPGMHRTDWDLKHTLPIDFAKLVALALERGQFGLQIKVFAEWVNLRPIVV